MPRAMDDTFHRLLWITLVAVAFTFTVILTSVFVDIDDLLAKRTSPVMKQQYVTEAPITELPEEFVDGIQGFPSNEEDTDENESTFRTKRSLESNNYVLHVKNPKMKKILTNRLATLLEELDEEETSKTNVERVAADSKYKNLLNPRDLSTEETVQNKERTLNIKDLNYDKLKNRIDQKDVLHLAMHNILLQGIVKHMDLNEVYKKIHLLIKSFETNTDNNSKDIYELKLNNSKPIELMKIVSHDSYKEEDKFFNEMIKCEKLQKEILQSQSAAPKAAEKTEKDKDSHMIIKTIIEITNDNTQKDGFKNSNENATNNTKFVYNGQEIKPEYITDTKNIQNARVEKNRHNSNSFNTKSSIERPNINESEIEEAIANYLRTHSLKFFNKYNLMAKGSFVSKRLKRQIKIHYVGDQITTEKTKLLKRKPQRHDNELYVEIETHFDGKGTKGEKKKKLVRTLIDKIQKAINSNSEVLGEDKTVQLKRLQIKKRLQDPIEQNDVNTVSPVKVIEHRELNPISKTANLIQPLSSVLDKSGDTWKKMYNGPGFLTASKPGNSAEMRELDIDYNTVLKNGIPKRLQKPINTESENLIKPDEYKDIGNVTLYLKDINGSGFSIGINQYADELPDKETLKMFTGLKNLIQAYHDHYDQNEAESNQSEDQAYYGINTNHEIKRRDVNKHINIIKQEPLNFRSMDYKNHEKNIFKFTETDQQKHRAINVKLFSNIKSKTKLSKFINTNAMATKKIFLNSKRSKRQINNIKIVASDRYPSTSGEDIFLVSRENIYADKSLLREKEVPEVEIGDRDEERYDFIAPYSYDIGTSKLQPPYLSSIYDIKSLHTGLMSKYPHIFVDNISRSKELINVNPVNTIEEKSNQKIFAQTSINTVNDDKANDKNMSSTNVADILNAVLPSRNNFKVVVKIFPKNKTNVGPGYKEVHTLINKSYDKNGVRYVSSLNVSEVSKFENLNEPKGKITATRANESEMDRRQNQIKILLQLHKERIDQQLEHLKLESQKLKQMIGYENLNKNMSHLINVFKQLGIKTSYDTNYLRPNDEPSTYKTTTSNTFSSQSKTTINTPIKKQEEPETMKLLNTIKKNENITREILQEIENNTKILHNYLQKLLNQTQSTLPLVLNNKKLFINDTPKNLIDNQTILRFLEKVDGNLTVSIPIIYTFLQPLMQNNKPLATVANLIYREHKHANKIENDEKKDDFLKSSLNNLKMDNIKKSSNNEKARDNATRFFIDELENDFKIMSNFNDRISVLSAVKTNGTKV